MNKSAMLLENLFEEEVAQKQDHIDPLSFVKNTQPKKRSTPVPEVEIVGPIDNLGWEDQGLKESAAKKYLSKDIVQWTRLDLRRYVCDKYLQKYGGLMSFAPALAFSALNAIQFSISQQTKIECDNIGLKNYVDYFFEHFADDVIRKEKKGLTFYTLSYQKYINAYVSQLSTRRHLESLAEPEPSLSAELNLKSVQAAFKINPTRLLTKFGVLIAANFLVMVKKQTAEKAIFYINSALDKIHKDEVVSATEKYNPYPTWLIIKDLSLFNMKASIQISADNQLLEFLRS
jgi:hypothetical protein